MRVAKLVGFLVLRGLWIATMVLVPLFGFWLASSLAAFENASQLAALLVGLLLFPIVPVGWELFYTWRRRNADPAAKQILTRLDRLVLRTLLVNGLFLGITLWRAPETSFRALAVRGDWLLDGHHGDTANAIRGAMFAITDRFEQRWHREDRHSDDYGESDVAPEDIVIPEAPAEPTPETPITAESAWPLPNTVDVQVSSMPADVKGSPKAVAEYLKVRFPEPKRLAKAIHDFVVLHVTYDEASLAATLAGDRDKRAPQDADTVLATKLGVCEGYARLYVAIGEAAGLETKYITGFIRDSQRRVASSAAFAEATAVAALEGYRHAWNAVKLDGTWYLVDPTWDDPIGAKEPETTYFLTPPKYFAYDHFPEEAAWQLVAEPMSASDFVRQPMLTPRAGELGLTLVAPARSQVDADDGVVELVFDHPKGTALVGDVIADGSKDRKGGVNCATKQASATRTKLACTMGRGEFELRVFGGKAKGPSYAYVGSILANSR